MKITWISTVILIMSPEKFEGCNDGYHRLNNLLNPKSPYEGFELFMLLKTIGTIVRHGMPTLKQAVACGQYHYPKGFSLEGTDSKRGLKVIGSPS